MIAGGDDTRDRCDFGWTHFAPSDACYKAFPGPVSWEEARSACQSSHKQARIFSIGGSTNIHLPLI